MSKAVTVVMTVGPGGGRPRTWMVGPPLLPEWAQLGACHCGTEVTAEVARILIDPASAPLLGGRQFEIKAEGPTGREDAPEGGESGDAQDAGGETDPQLTSGRFDPGPAGRALSGELDQASAEALAEPAPNPPKPKGSGPARGSAGR